MPALQWLDPNKPNKLIWSGSCWGGIMEAASKKKQCYNWKCGGFWVGGFSENMTTRFSKYILWKFLHDDVSVLADNIGFQKERWAFGIVSELIWCWRKRRTVVKGRSALANIFAPHYNNQIGFERWLEWIFSLGGPHRGIRDPKYSEKK